MRFISWLIRVVFCAKIHLPPNSVHVSKSLGAILIMFDLLGTKLSTADRKNLQILCHKMEGMTRWIKIKTLIVDHSETTAPAKQNHLGDINRNLSNEDKVKNQITSSVGASGNKKHIDKVKNIIAVCSNKGGVGKSSLSLSLAYAMAKNGFRIGLADLDIYGSSLPILSDQINSVPDFDEKIRPICFERSGYQISMMSMGFMVDTNLPIVWRGPMISKSIHNILFGCDWGELDFLILDTPPATGDAHLTIFTQTNISLSLVVTTQNELGHNGAVKIIDFLNKMNVPILGTVTNMHNPAYHSPNDIQDITTLQSIPFDQSVFFGKSKESILWENNWDATIKAILNHEGIKV